MLNLSSVMIGSSDSKALAEFYEKVLGKEADWGEEEWYGWQLGGWHLTLGPHSEVNGKAEEPQIIMLNLETKKVKAEFERIKGLGAKVVKEPYEMDGGWIATFADPDGNYFQLLTPWENNK